jgi:hypothetical protein
MIKEEREAGVKAEDGEWVFDISHPDPDVFGTWKQNLGEQGIVDWEVKPLDNGDFEIEYKDLQFGKDDFSIDFNITLEDYSCAPLAEVFQSSDIHNHFVMYNSKNEMMVDMDLDDGTIIFGETYTPDEAAKLFWDTIGKMANRPVEETTAEYYNMSAPPGIADDMPEEYMLETRTVEAIEPLTGWTLTEEECISEVDEDLVKDIVKDIQASHFDNTMKGLIDG